MTSYPGNKYEQITPSNLLSVNYLFFLVVYFPSSNHSMEEFRETLDLLWVICDSYSIHCVVTIMGDFNCHLGHLCGGRSPVILMIGEN